MNKTLTILGVALLGILIVACNPKLTQKVVAPTQQFTQEQQDKILDQHGDSPMRVYLITDERDSLLLRSQSESVIPDSTDLVLERFIQRLYSTVRDSMSMGVGIAAPQVGILKEIIWVQRFDKEEFPFEYYLNPKITQNSNKTVAKVAYQFRIEVILQKSELKQS